MKILNDDQYKSMKTRAESWDAVATGVAGDDVDGAADVTPQSILDALQAREEEVDTGALNAQVEELTRVVSERDQTIADQATQIEALTAKVGEQESTIAERDQQITALQDGPATDKVEDTTTEEVTGSETDPIKAVFKSSGEDYKKLGQELKKTGLM